MNEEADRYRRLAASREHERDDYKADLDGLKHNIIEFFKDMHYEHNLAYLDMRNQLLANPESYHYLRMALETKL